LHTKERQEETCSTLIAALDPSISCDILSAEGFQQGFSSLPPKTAEELFREELADSEICKSPLSAEFKRMQTASINFDNSLSPAHTLLQIIIADQKGLIYDILRTLKDCNIQVLGDNMHGLLLLILVFSVMTTLPFKHSECSARRNKEND
jgi:hypothetical protein